MIKTADIGIAFCAKPALQAVADLVITNRDLREVLANL
jgi:phosphoserine phosphatase